MKTQHAASCFPYLCLGDQILQILSVLNHSRNRYGDMKQEPASREAPGKLLPQHWCWHHLDEVILRLRASCFQKSNWIWGRTPLFLLSSWGISGGKSIVLPCLEMKNQRIKALQQLSWRLQNQPQLRNTAEKHRTLHLHPGPKPSHTPVRHAQLKAPKASTNLVCSTLRETVNRPKKEYAKVIEFTAANYAWIAIKIKATILLHVRKSIDCQSYKVFTSGFKGCRLLETATTLSMRHPRWCQWPLRPGPRWRHSQGKGKNALVKCLQLSNSCKECKFGTTPPLPAQSV